MQVKKLETNVFVKKVTGKTKVVLNSVSSMILHTAAQTKGQV